jgi:hypothetical protein
MNSAKLNSVEKDVTSKPKAKGMSRASKPRKSATKSPPKASTKGDWRGETLAQIRALILEADSEMIEEVKWRKPSNAMAGVPVWSHNGIVCTGETYSKVVKLTFAKGASLPNPSRLFNSSLEGNTRRAIDIREGETIDSGAFKALIKAAVAANGAPSPAKRRSPLGTTSSMDELLRFPSAVRHEPAIDRWLRSQRVDLRPFVAAWFERMRACGGDVRELMHDGCPTACVDDAAFAYVNAFRDHVNIGFFWGACLKDPARLLAGTGKRGRHVKLRPGSEIDSAALARLVEAAYLDIRARLEKSREKPMSRKAKPKAKPSASEATATKLKKNEHGVVLLSGGNPQIAKADGDAPVQAYIDAMPGWKRDVGRWLDALIDRTVPDVQKAVRWNTPFYGIEGQGWFLGFHCITKYIKVAFFRGTSLRPLPPIESKQKEVRYLHIHEHDQLDEKLVASWIRQASELPGEPLF